METEKKKLKINYFFSPEEEIVTVLETKFNYENANKNSENILLTPSDI